jgi:hypothetical protein
MKVILLAVFMVTVMGFLPVTEGFAAWEKLGKAITKCDTIGFAFDVGISAGLLVGVVFSTFTFFMGTKVKV